MTSVSSRKTGCVTGVGNESGCHAVNLLEYTCLELHSASHGGADHLKPMDDPVISSPCPSHCYGSAASSSLQNFEDL
jgi:hypothetical protein